MNDLIRKLRGLSEKPEPMIPLTLRLPVKVDKEMREFCDEHEIKLATVLRESAARGWQLLKDEVSRELAPSLRGIHEGE